MSRTAGALAAATLALALLTSCASAPAATPTAPVVVPTATPIPTATRVPTPTSTLAPVSPTSGPKPGAPPTATAPPKPAEKPPTQPARPPAEAKPKPAEPPSARQPAPPTGAPSPAARRPRPKPGAGGVPFTAADGYLADGEVLSPFDTAHPAVGNLAAELRVAVQRAARDAARAGVDLVITSGWRSVRHQQALLNAAIAEYGSEAEARRWVNTPEKSAHVTGRAVDVGPMDGQVWLREHGERYGLCQIYANEAWHYELATAPGGTCPRPIADASAG